MKKIENYDKVKADDGYFNKPGNGGYILGIANVKDVPIDEKTGKGDYLWIEYDIAHGEFSGYYMKMNEKFGGNWSARFIRSYKERALGMFKHFINCIEDSNPAFCWNWKEESLIGCRFGATLQEEEYEKQDGSVGTRLVVKDIKTVKQIMDGDFKVPTTKKLERTVAPVSDFATLNDLDDSLPF